VLLDESGMQLHPLTPMNDPNLVRVLQAQSARRVGLIDYKSVAAGEQAVLDRVDELRSQGVAFAVVDAISNEDLMRLGRAVKGMPLVTAGSGLAIGLPQNFGISASPQASELPRAGGLRAVVSGSCSQATNGQMVEFIRSGNAALGIDPLRIAGGIDVARHLVWQLGPCSCTRRQIQVP
jgi:3-dehydrotetronate 4-kinase